MCARHLEEFCICIAHHCFDNVRALSIYENELILRPPLDIEVEPINPLGDIW